MHGPILKLGRYEILEQIASGGMATVYKGKLTSDHGFEKTLAIKVLHPHLAEDEQFVKMFIDEGRVGAELNHPNIISTIDFGEIDGYYFLALEHFESTNLNEILKYLRKKGEKLSVEIFLYIVIEVLKALSYAHSKCDEKGNALGIVHRDISPHNILISFDGCIKLCDFGIARGKHRSDFTATGIIKGKIPYMSPEQIKGEEIDQRSDIYSLGIVMAEMLSENTLFKDLNEDKIRHKILNNEIKIEFSKSVPEDIVLVIKKAISYNKEERFQSSKELLEEFLSIDKIYGNERTPSKIKEFFSSFKIKPKDGKNNREVKRLEDEKKEDTLEETSLKSAKLILYLALLILILALFFEIFSINIIQLP